LFPTRDKLTHAGCASSPVAVAGVAVGSGWQALVAYVNVGSYYLIGVPLGILLGWPLHFGVGVMLQTLHS